MKEARDLLALKIVLDWKKQTLPSMFKIVRSGYSKKCGIWVLFLVWKRVKNSKKRKDAERKESLLGKPLHGKYFATVEKLAEEGFVDLDRSWQWLKGGFLTKASEGFIMAAQEQALQTRWRKSTIEGSDEVDGLCRICGEWWKIVMKL